LLQAGLPRTSDVGLVVEIRTGSPGQELRLDGRATERPTAAQRLLTLAGGGRTHADRHQAVVGLGDQRLLEWRLYEVLRP
jgi:hypothetical protein